MLIKQFFNKGKLLRPSPAVTLLLPKVPLRMFALPKYQFEDESYVADRYQVSMKSHKTNAEELINALPVVEVDGDTARCTGVNELGLGHPVQYI